ncbi:MAG: hypothetical protein IRY85_01715 [Micromonosporaceae bacterium]|nr:hypothetical protein [Micromonosporaceae bacterium]
MYPDLYTVVLLSNQDGVLLPALRRTQQILTGGEPLGPVIINPIDSW